MPEKSESARTRLARLLDRVGRSGLPSLRAVVTRVLEVVSDPKASIERVREAVEASSLRSLELLANMEDLVEQRTRQLDALRRVLEQKGRELQVMLDASPAMVFFQDSAGRYVRVNRLFAETVGLPIASVVGHDGGDLFPDFGDWGRAEHETVLNTGAPVLKREVVLDTPRGERRLLVDRFPYRGTGGDVIGSIGFALDVTERVRAEEERRRLEQQLDRARKMESLGLLAGGVAHDLNNHFTPLIGFAELILLRVPSDGPIAEDVRKMKRSAQEASEIVQDLLTLTRRAMVLKEPLDLNETVTAYLDSPVHQDLASRRPEVRVATRLEPELPNVMGSGPHLRKMFMNLVRNAFEAMPEGGDLEIATSRRRLRAGYSGYETVPPGDYAAVSIADRGVGISAEDLQRIFEPFFTRKALGRSGSGLGMAVVWGTLKDHGGYVDVRSRPGEGATFTLYLPTTSLSPRSSEPTPIRDLMGAGQRLLVVDDEPAQRDVAARVLTQLGYEVTALRGGPEAVAHAADHPVDVILMDMALGGDVDGLDLYRRILEVRPGVPAVIVSAFPETDRVRQAQKLGAAAYVRKPYTLEAIALAVRQARNLLRQA